ncbi:MAG: hypothetical protein ACOY93_03460 [Bacillota bacterium]
MLCGDVDRLYHALRKDHPTPPSGACRHLNHVRSIARYYQGMNQQERLLMLAWAKKEESGIGMIPLALSGIPFFGLLFGSRIQEPLSRLPVWAVFSIWGVASLLLLSGFYLHQRQKAYTMLHIVLLEQAVKQAEAPPSRRRSRPTLSEPPEARPDPPTSPMAPH